MCTLRDTKQSPCRAPLAVIPRIALRLSLSLSFFFFRVFPWRGGKPTDQSPVEKSLGAGGAQR